MAAEIGPLDPKAVIEQTILDRSNNPQAVAYRVVLPDDRQRLLDEWERHLSEGAD